jgi:DNA-binding MarR family transcriptional regulator
MSPGALLSRTLVTSGTMTHRIDRLSDKGLVERLPDPRDRRGVLVRLTPSGRRRVDAALSALLDREREILGVLTPQQQEALAGWLRTLVLPFDEAIDAQ